jgi:hypothetical protein
LRQQYFINSTNAVRGLATVNAQALRGFLKIVIPLISGSSGFSGRPALFLRLKFHAVESFLFVDTSS